MSSRPDAPAPERPDARDEETTGGEYRGAVGMLARAVVFVLASVVTGALVGWGATLIGGTDMPKWVLARASGVASFVLLTAVTVLGLLLSHPHRARWRWPALVTRLRLHVALAVAALVLTVGHLVVLALDDYADVGWPGALLPFVADYRPVATGIGVLAFWAMLLASSTAGLAGRALGRRLWWPIHKAAIVAYLLAWGHAVLGGTDVRALLGLYLVAGGLVVGVAIWRYASIAPGDARRAFARTARPGLGVPRAAGFRAESRER
ncbi:MAG: ferric reductase-like transmembrane domain-containing protein [Actinomycetales bacterium]|nr:ferric reductase-like transmembrane domain-containing protein [Actinomycetales bacterium]